MVGCSAQDYAKFAIDRHMYPIALTRILKKLARSAGCTPEEVFSISGHSLRVGAAQQLTINGVQLLPIMLAWGWRLTNVVARYLEKVHKCVGMMPHGGEKRCSG